MPWALSAGLALGCSSTGGGGGDDTGSETGASSTENETQSGSDEGSESGSDWSCDDPFCEDIPQPAECGNGKVEGSEDCDGDVDHATCDDCVVVCDEGWWDCNGDVVDGCEIHLDGDPLNCGDCDHDCLGGECEVGTCQPVVLVEGESAPLNVAVDETHVYWTNFQASGSVVRATSSGGNRTVLTDAVSPFDLALDDESVFFTSDDEIARVPKVGGASTPLISGTGEPRGVAVDDSDVFYVDLGNADGDVESIPKMGGGEDVLAANESSPRFLTVMNGFVYWTDDADATVSRVAADGMGAVEVLATDQVGAWDIFSTPDLLAWTNLADVGEVKWLSLEDLMDERTLAISLRPWGIAIDDAHVYWTTEEDGTVQRSAVDGEQELAEMIATGLQTPHGIATDDQFVYWADTAAGAIMRVAK